MCAQSNPLIGALYGVLYWREFDGSSLLVKVYFVVMCVFYSIAIVLIFLSVK